MESKGQIGYATGKAPSFKTINPSKIRKTLPLKPMSTTITTTESETESEYQDSDESDKYPSTRKKYCKTNTATKLVISSKLSTHRAATVCRKLPQDGISIETPSQSGVYKSTIKQATKLKEMKKTLQLENWSLHFDGKRLDNHKYQLLVLKNE